MSAERKHCIVCLLVVRLIEWNGKKAFANDVCFYFPIQSDKGRIPFIGVEGVVCLQITAQLGANNNC
jgi:hypothetical protein